jgi:hypothetical protein
LGGERPGVGPLSVDVHELLEVGVEELEDEVEDGLAVLVGLLDGEELDEVEGVGEEVEEGDLAESGGRDALLVHLEAGLLERHQLARHLVLRLVHLAVGAFPDLLQLLVLLQDVHRRHRRKGEGETLVLVRSEEGEWWLGDLILKLGRGNEKKKGSSGWESPPLDEHGPRGQWLG